MHINIVFLIQLFPCEDHSSIWLLSKDSSREYQNPLRSIRVRIPMERMKPYRDEIKKMRVTSLQKLLHGTNRRGKTTQKRPAQSRQTSVRQIVPSMRKSPTGRH